jgi:hypothetical protein
MRHLVSAVCCLIVGLQVLIGVPLAVCAAFCFLVAGESIGPVALEMHAGHASSPALVPPPNYISHNSGLAENPILATRAECGSPLAGTVLETESPAEEAGLFVAAIEKIAAANESCSAVPSPCDVAICTARPAQPANLHETANRFAVEQLYAIAESDERVGQFERADQWRALARKIRKETTADPLLSPTAPDVMSSTPHSAELPF